MSLGKSSATSVKAIQENKKLLTNMLKQLETVPTQILEEEAKRVYAEAVSEAPFKTGALERAIYVRVSKDKRRPGLVLGASIRKGRYDYSKIQHESPQFKHPIKGKAWYLRDPFERAINRIYARFKEEIHL